jgi:hypothetical protein
MRAHRRTRRSSTAKRCEHASPASHRHRASRAPLRSMRAHRQRTVTVNDPTGTPGRSSTAKRCEHASPASHRHRASRAPLRSMRAHCQRTATVNDRTRRSSTAKRCEHASPRTASPASGSRPTSAPRCEHGAPEPQAKRAETSFSTDRSEHSAWVPKRSEGPSPARWRGATSRRCPGRGCLRPPRAPAGTLLMPCSRSV